MRHRIKKIPTLSKLNHKFNHHLLHSDKSTYTYFYNQSKVKVGSLIKHILYSPSIPLLGGAALLLVLGLSVGCVGEASGVGNSNGIVYAESTPAEECNAGNTVLSLDMSGDMSLSTSVDNDISNGNISYLSKDFTVTACRTAGYKVYVQANSSKLQNQQAPDALFGVGENKSVIDFTDNTWGYAVDEATKDNTAMIYNTMPEPSTSRTESYSEDTSTGATGKNLKITFAAKFGKDKVAGHYTSDVLMSVVANAKDTVIYSITYDGNGNTDGTVPAMQESEETNAANYVFTVANNTGNLTKPGYIFTGWAERNTATAAQYQPNATITLSKNSPTKTLYAVWTTDPTIQVNSWDELIFMQQMSPAACSGGNETGKQLVDSRDDKFYWVAKLKDGNCWMTQNLAIDLTGKTLTSNDSDVSSNWTPTATGWSENNSINWQISTTGSGHDSYGGYYTWQAATANTAPKNTGEASSSICPKGWRLPINGSNTTDKSYAQLTNNLSWTTIQDAPYYFVLSGYIDGGKPDDVGNYGFYWSSTARTSSDANALGFWNSILMPSYSGNRNNYRYFGRSVRCVAR